MNNTAGELLVMTFGMKDQCLIVNALSDFIDILSNMMDVSVKYILEHSGNEECDEDCFLNKGKNYLSEMKCLLEQTELKINKENTCSFYVLGL